MKDSQWQPNEGNDYYWPSERTIEGGRKVGGPRWPRRYWTDPVTVVDGQLMKGQWQTKDEMTDGQPRQSQTNWQWKVNPIEPLLILSGRTVDRRNDRRKPESQVDGQWRTTIEPIDRSGRKLVGWPDRQWRSGRPGHWRRTIEIEPGQNWKLDRPWQWIEGNDRQTKKAKTLLSPMADRQPSPMKIISNG